MKVYKYKNYKEYADSQVAAYNRKFKNVWAVEENIKFLSEYLNKFFQSKPLAGLCHGVRQGLEMEWFEKYLQPFSNVSGTDIGGSCADNIFKWDFNELNIEWLNKFDFIYSNSFDHAFNPESTLQVWSGQCKRGGMILLEYDKRQEHTGEISKGPNKTDPVSITIDELIEKIPVWLKGSKIIDVLDMPVVKKGYQKTIVIEV